MARAEKHTGKLIKHFCERTHLHGFADMIRAKYWPGKTFWAAIISMSLAMTAISVFQAVENFFANPTHVVIEHKRTTEDMIYPPLKVCHEHWISWVNFSAAEQMNFTKHEVLFALSFLTSVHTDERAEELDAEKTTEKSFYEKLVAHKLPSLEKFYSSVAFKKRKFIRNLKNDSYDYEIEVYNTEIDALKPPNYTICYKYAGEVVKDMLLKISAERIKLYRSPMDRVALLLSPSQIVAEPNEILAWLTTSEYEVTMKYLSNTSTIPFYIMPDGYSKKGKKFTGPAVQILVNVIIQLWKNSSNALCHQDRAWISSNETCSQACKEQLANKNLKKEKISTNIGNIPDKTDIDAKAIAAKDMEGYETCVESCKLETGCESWVYSFYYTSLPDFETGTNILLLYPSNTIAMKEVNVKTWENFVGNIGGLLGIWTGASFLTFLQIVYLCCCQGRVGVAEE